MVYSNPDCNAHCLKNPIPITAEGYVPASPEPGVCVPDEELLSQSQFTKNKFFNMQKISSGMTPPSPYNPFQRKSNPKVTPKGVGLQK